MAHDHQIEFEKIEDNVTYYNVSLYANGEYHRVGVGVPGEGRRPIADIHCTICNGLSCNGTKIIRYLKKQSLLPHP